MKRFKRISVVGLTLLSVGCGSSNSSSSSKGTVNVKFQNSGAVGGAALKEPGLITSLTPGFIGWSWLTTGSDPVVFQMKLVAMYIVEDIDSNSNNVGALTRIWTSSKCDASLTLCGIGPAAGTYKAEYFDFAQSSATVNTTLSSYARDTAESQISAGTYRYIRLDFQGATGAQTDTTTANMKFGLSSGTTYEVRAQNSQKDVKFTSAMTIVAGETFTVQLGYDITKSFYATGNSAANTEVTADSRKLTCASGTAGSNGTNCFAEPTWVPTVTKN